MIPGERIIELALELIIKAMEGQTPEQKKIMWDWYIEDIKFWRKLFKMDKVE